MPKGFDIKRFLALFASFTLAAGFIFSGTAAADVNNFTVTDFSADYYLTNADPQGQMRVVEKISVDFTDNNHGILRALPETYKDHPLHLHINGVGSASGAPAQYTTYTSNGNEVLKIGDPNRTVTGAQDYTIAYTEQNVITFYHDHDELYWDINGDQWDQPFTAVRATIHVPAGLKLSTQKATCFAGVYGSKAHGCSYFADNGIIKADAYNLAPQSTLTVVVGFQKGYFHPMTWLDYAQDYGSDVLEFLTPVILIGGAGFIWWFKRGRDAKGTGIIIPQYDAPDGMKPLEVGTIVDFKVDNRDITAAIVDLAVRKYIKIIENDKKKLLLGKTKTFSLQLINNDLRGLNEWEQDVMAGLFPENKELEVVDLSKMRTKLYIVAQSVRDSVERSLTARGYFAANPVKYLGLSLASTIIFAFFIGAAFHGIQALLLFGGIVGLILFGIFYRLLPARTAKGVAANEHILGLKMYIEVAEKDRIKKLQSPDAPYADRPETPQHTVELFEKLLPYAIALNVERQWADKFKDIYKSPPDWYAGNYTAFNAGYLAGSLNSGFTSAVNSSFSAPRSSGGSGFGGGAGGGGGGGGGGGW